MNISQKQPNSHTIKQSYKQAEHIGKLLKEEIERTIELCRQDTYNHTDWIENAFKPALEALASGEKSPVRRLSDACIPLNIFGGMGSYSDGGPNSDALWKIYTNANNFYQSAWEERVV